MSRPPLAERLRPRQLEEVIGQEAAIAPLRAAADRRELPSALLWGPPGCGKTTVARLLAQRAGLELLSLSAVLEGLPALREVLEAAERRRRLGSRSALLVDEIHRWNKAQQDALLPHVEEGRIVLLGATTENPLLQVAPALRSRVLVVRLEPLPVAAVQQALERALVHPDGLPEWKDRLDPAVLARLAWAAGGDVRQALVDLEALTFAAGDRSRVGPEDLATLLPSRPLRHDRDGGDHHDVLSALIKSLRGSDPDAALYWLARLIRGGEDGRGILRRLMIFAAEDVGNADPRALGVAVDGALAFERIGMPEGRIVLGQVVTWLATCPKSNAAYLAIDAALAEVDRSGALPVPEPLRNTPGLGERAAYRYPHDYPDALVAQDYLPSALRGRVFYQPTARGAEKTITERQAWWRGRLARRQGAPQEPLAGPTPLDYSVEARKT